MPVNVSTDRMEQLHHQLESRLRPVLREKEYDRFDLDRAISAVRLLATALGHAP
jgi:hypothetical protein